MVNNHHAFLRSRRTIRKFKPDPIPDDSISRILETTICSPSAHNLQPWHFIIISSRDSKLRLAKAITRKFRLDLVSDGASEEVIEAKIDKSMQRIIDAPIIIVLCHNKNTLRSHHNPISNQTELELGVQSVTLAGLQLLLAAHAEGLGGNWICWPFFAPDETQAALKLNSNLDPIGMIFLGFPAEDPEMPERKPLSEVTSYI
jgi:coenzyme F420-0:L-glutamate ligase / coenzyme F420-1:gamma-L-glutamate ligase